MLHLSKSLFSFKYYLCAIGTTNLATGLHGVLYPWLVIGVLEGSPSQLGFAQMALLIPNLLFILPAGVISDRWHQASWLSLLYLMYLIPLIALISAVSADQLNINVVVGFGLIFGTITAFAQPARESLLGYAESDAMHKLVAKTLVVRFAALGVGYLLAGLLGLFGLSSLLAMQMCLFSITSFLILRSYPRKFESTAVAKDSRDLIVELREGLALFKKDKRLLHLLLIVFATGLLPFGAFVVGTPVLARQEYQGNAVLLAFIQVAFILGVVSANLGVMRKSETFPRPGRSMIVSFFWRGALLFFIALKPDFWVLFPAVFLWGVSSGIAMALGRTIIHDQVLITHRARAVSVYQLGLFGGTPIGAWLCGIAIEAVGYTSAMSVIAFSTVVVALATALRSPLWSLSPNRVNL